MPIRTHWWSFVESVVGIDRNQPGVYELGDENGIVVYIGSSDDLKRRLTEHLNEEPYSCIRQNATQYRIEYTAEYEKREGELHRAHIGRHRKPPKCNNSIRPSGD
jgi:predicted GIY-YIG superfamily endonuclease